MKLLGTNNKLDKQSSRGEPFVLRGLSLAPADLSGYETCPMRTADCTKACIGVKSGHNRFNPAKEAKIRKTKLFFEDNETFMNQLFREINNLRKYCNRLDKRPVVRLNTYSDIVWEKKHPEIFLEFPDVQFYDYTKIHQRRNLPDNYHLTLSYTGYNWKECEVWLSSGRNVAVVFKACWDNPLPDKWRGFDVVAADEDDCRWLEAPGKISGLRTKGSVKNAGPFFADATELTVGGLPVISGLREKVRTRWERREVACESSGAIK